MAKIVYKNKSLSSVCDIPLKIRYFNTVHTNAYLVLFVKLSRKKCTIKHHFACRVCLLWALIQFYRIIAWALLCSCMLPILSIWCERMYFPIRLFPHSKLTAGRILCILSYNPASSDCLPAHTCSTYMYIYIPESYGGGLLCDWPNYVFLCRLCMSWFKFALMSRFDDCYQGFCNKVL